MTTLLHLLAGWGAFTILFFLWAWLKYRFGPNPLDWGDL
jgi:hypothetical protein